MLLTRITLFTVTIQVIYCGDNFNIDTANETRQIYACIRSVITKNFPCGTSANLVNLYDDQFAHKINDDQYCYSFIIRSFNDKDWLATPLYIIVALDSNELMEGISSISKDLFWNPKARFIIHISKIEETELKLVFETLLQHNVFDVIVIRKTEVVIIETYNPYKDKNCGKELQIEKIGNCKDVEQLIIFRNPELNMKDCSVKIAVVQDIPYIIFKNEEYKEDGKNLLGIEQFVLETIAEKEGIYLEYIYLQHENVLELVMENYTATGSLEMLQNNEADVAVGGLVLMRNRALLFDYIWGYSYAAYTVYTPAAGEEIWKAFYNEFDDTTWVVVIIAYSIFVVITSIRQKIFRANAYKSLALELWGYFFLNTSTKLWKEKRFRATIAFWIWFTYMMNNFFTTGLSSLLTGRDQTEGHITFDHIHELPYEPCISIFTRTFFLYAFNQTLPEGPDIPECLYTDSALDYVAEEGNVYAIEMEYLYKINDYKSNDEHSNSMLDIWRFSSSNVISMFVNKGFPLSHIMQLHILRIFESGLLKLQLDKIIRIRNKNPEPGHHVHYEDLSLSDLRVYFGALIVGYIVSLLCFVLEVIWHWRVQKKRSHN